MNTRAIAIINVGTTLIVLLMPCVLTRPAPTALAVGVRHAAVA